MFNKQCAICLQTLDSTSTMYVTEAKCREVRVSLVHHPQAQP